MRTNLKVPYPEKDTAKALGARWDSAKKLWYITDVTDLTPFLRWIPDMETAMGSSTDAMKRSTKNTAKARVNHFQGPTTGPTIDVPHCGCNVLPWEDCEHTTTP